jgi:hypothetical protein
VLQAYLVTVNAVTAVTVAWIALKQLRVRQDLERVNGAQMEMLRRAEDAARRERAPFAP